MLEVSKEYKLLSNAETQRVKELDRAIEVLEQQVNIINTFISNSEKRWVLMEAKLKKERLVALTALTKSKLLLAEMHIFIAENELNNQIQENVKDVKLNRKGNSHSTASLVASSSIKPHRSSSANSASRNCAGQDSLTSLDIKSISSKSFSNTRSTSALKEDSIIKKSVTPAKRVQSAGPKFRNISKCDKQKNKSPESSTPFQHSDGKENFRKHNTSAIDPVPPASATPINLDKKKTLTKSIIAEINHSYLTKENSLALEKHAKKRKINPVTNVDSYKRLKLSHHLPESHRTTAAKIRPPLHSGDPRTYPTCDTKHCTQTTMRFPVPQFESSRPVPTKEITKVCQNVPSSYEQVPRTGFGTSYHIQNRIAIADSENVTPPPTVLLYKHGKTPQGEVVDNYNHLSHFSKNTKNICHRVSSNNTQVTSVNRHICVPDPPMYKSSRNIDSLNRNEIPALNYSPKYTS